MQKQNKLKILQLCHYSSGGCGVWARVKQESLELTKKGYEVMIFSSNFEKGTDKIMPSSENINGLKIRRFPAKKLGGESFLKWNFEKAALAYSPDIIMAHNYRQIPTTMALKVAEKLRAERKKVKVFLVTHAPFVEGDITRSFISKLVVKFYDRFIGPRTLNRFDKILVISHWEIPYLIKAGAKKEKIVYIPNGIPQEFFTLKKQAKQENKILFLGRISPKKKIETLISAIPLIKSKSVKIEILGPQEEDYFKKISNLARTINVENRIIFSPAVYDLEKKIAKIDSCIIFVLPSRVEGMPQSLIEAMARGKIVIGSDSIAIRDLIKNEKNGLLFEFDNPSSLANAINYALEIKGSKIQDNARKFAEQFNWKKVIAKIEELF